MSEAVDKVDSSKLTSTENAEIANTSEIKLEYSANTNEQNTEVMSKDQSKSTPEIIADIVEENVSSKLITTKEDEIQNAFEPEAEIAQAKSSELVKENVSSKIINTNEDGIKNADIAQAKSSELVKENVSLKLITTKEVDMNNVSKLEADIAEATSCEIADANDTSKLITTNEDDMKNVSELEAKRSEFVEENDSSKLITIKGDDTKNGSKPETDSVAQAKKSELVDEKSTLKIDSLKVGEKSASETDGVITDAKSCELVNEKSTSKIVSTKVDEIDNTATVKTDLTTAKIVDSLKIINENEVEIKITSIVTETSSNNTESIAISTKDAKEAEKTDTNEKDTNANCTKDDAQVKDETVATESTTEGNESALEEEHSSKAKDTTKSSTSDEKDDKHAEHVSYTEDGSAIYTDPKTKHKYKWSTEQNNWLSCESNPSSASSTTSADNPYENEHYKWCNETQEWLPKAQDANVDATQTATETEHYKWDAKRNEWVPKKVQSTIKPDDVTYDIDADGQRIYTDKDGTVFFWDTQKNAWFPKIDDEFMARYQMNYGFIDNTSAGEQEKRLKEEQEETRKEEELKRMTEEAAASEAASADATMTAAGGVKRKAPPEPPKWFDLDPEQNTKVYVSNLPLDITLDEFTELMGKCGMIMRDPQTQKYKLKLYTESDGQVKGDGLCDYIKVESVHLALNILDDSELRGNKIHVQRAKFQMRGEYNPALKPKRKKKDKEKLQKLKEKLFDWRPEKMRGERSKNEKTVILKNLFDPDIFEKEVQLILDYQNDLREECSKCGTVRKIVIYDRHADGVAQVNMASPEEADVVIQMMQGRFFGKRQLTAEHWDGKTKYKVEESEAEVKQRLSKWDTFLETDEVKNQVKNSESAQHVAEVEEVEEAVEATVDQSTVDGAAVSLNEDSAAAEVTAQENT